MTKHNKLVRDKIPAYLNGKGISHKEHIADEAEYEEKLFAKLVEEAEEVKKDKSKEEIADLLEVVEAIKALKGYSTEDIEAIRLQKLEEKGGFSTRVILEES